MANHGYFAGRIGADAMVGNLAGAPQHPR